MFVINLRALNKCVRAQGSILCVLFDSKCTNALAVAVQLPHCRVGPFLFRTLYTHYIIGSEPASVLHTNMQGRFSIEVILNLDAYSLF